MAPLMVSPERNHRYVNDLLEWWFELKGETIEWNAVWFYFTLVSCKSGEPRSSQSIYELYWYSLPLKLEKIYKLYFFIKRIFFCFIKHFLRQLQHISSPYLILSYLKTSTMHPINESITYKLMPEGTKINKMHYAFCY